LSLSHSASSFIPSSPSAQSPRKQQTLQQRPPGAKRETPIYTPPSRR
jgi:hypothetical protein